MLDKLEGGQEGEPKTSQPQNDFLFINSADDAHQGRARRNIRSFVMQKARKQKLWSTSKRNLSQSTSIPALTRTESTGGLELQLYNENNAGENQNLARDGVLSPFTSYSPSLLSPTTERSAEETSYITYPTMRTRSEAFPTPRLGAQAFSQLTFDPFNSLPITLDSKSHAILRYFSTVLASSIIPLDIRQQSTVPRNAWLAEALLNPALMCGLLCATSLHLCVLGKVPFEDVDRLKSQAVSQINSNLDKANMRISDSNIWAVHVMLCIEESLPLVAERNEPETDCYTVRSIHLSGLSRMVQLRGGLAAMSTNRCLQAFILWHFTAHATASCSLEHTAFSIPDQPSGIWDHCGSPLSSDREHTPNALPLHLQEIQADPDIIDIGHDLGLYAAALDQWFAGTDSSLPTDPLDLQNQASFLTIRLLRWLSRTNPTLTSASPSIPPSFSATVSHAICIVCIMFAVICSSTAQGFSTLHFTTVPRLKLVFESASDRHFCPWNLKLWACAIGAIAAVGSEEEEWFAWKLSTLCVASGVPTCEDLLERVSNLPWVGYRLDKALEAVWEHIWW
ncbi:hypothetical protein K402DRAFT_416238 [Aulographum hederae CBS 113979]|uniref:Transcription factor domain-containing protein n=1 Tax=Aulographum hederae CBS 113979 TaxID=1176131 RepID=A0A6G1HHT3_9PEZI|nr:hypothetical protein K402DRAFT_416238 [Aulographum hederae CBS 113979]